MRLHITLRELEIFCAIAQYESVFKASEYMGLTQSAASQALGKLERIMGQPLFDRHGRRLLINEHGRLLLPQARSVLERSQEVERMFSGGALSLKVGASTTIGNYLMPAKLAAFRQIYPGANLKLSVGNTEHIVNMVANFEVDYGFIEGGCHHPDLYVSSWQDDELVVFISSKHPAAHQHLSSDELAKMPWLLREQGSGTREEVERMLQPHLKHFNLDMEVGDSEAIKHAVAAGLGVSCLSRYVIADLLEKNEVVPVISSLPVLNRQLRCIRHKAKELTRGMLAFLNFNTPV